MAPRATTTVCACLFCSLSSRQQANPNPWLGAIGRTACQSHAPLRRLARPSISTVIDMTAACQCEFVSRLLSAWLVGGHGQSCRRQAPSSGLSSRGCKPGTCLKVPPLSTHTCVPVEPECALVLSRQIGRVTLLHSLFCLEHLCLRNAPARPPQVSALAYPCASASNWSALSCIYTLSNGNM